MKKIISLLLVFVSLFCTSNVFAIDYENVLNDTIDYIVRTVDDPQVNSIGGEWAVIAAAKASGASESWFNTYMANLNQFLAEKNSNVLNSRKSTDNARVVLALSALGIDASDYRGYDLVSPLLDLSYTSKQGVNGVIFALQAIDSYKFNLVTNPRSEYISYLASKQLPDGGWALSGSEADADITAMAIQALSPYKDSDPTATNLINSAIDCLSTLQEDNGMYSSWGSVNSESCAQVIIALCMAGMKDDSRFIKDGVSVFDALMSFYDPSTHAFSHELGGEINQMATEQAALALCYYNNHTTMQSDDDHTPIDLFLYYEDGVNYIDDTLDLYYVDDWNLKSIITMLGKTRLSITYKDGEFIASGKHIKLRVYVDDALVDNISFNIPLRESQSIKFVKCNDTVPKTKFSINSFMLPSTVYMLNK